MFIEYEIKEGIINYKGIININNICVIKEENDHLYIFYGQDMIVFNIQPTTLYNAFRRSLLGESIQMNGIGFVRPLEPPKTPSLAPVKTMTWRDVP